MGKQMVMALVLGAAACLVSLGLVVRWALAQPVFAVSKIVVEGDTSHHNALTLKANVHLSCVTRYAKFRHLAHFLFAKFA